MKSTVIFYRNLLKSLSFLLVYASAFVIVSGFISGVNQYEMCELVISFLFPFYVVYFNTKNAQKGIAAAFCLMSSCLVYQELSGSYYSLVFILAVSLLLAKLFEIKRVSYAAFAGFFALILVALLFGYLHPLLNEYLKAFAKLISGKGALFGVVKSFYELFISDSLTKLFYNTSYSKSEVINGGIVSGAVNVFKADRNNSVCAEYLTGAYFADIFLPLGIFASLIKSMRDDLKLAFVFSLAASVITGESTLFLLFVLVYNPVLYFAFILVSYISYIVPPLINLNVGFVNNASLIELFKYGNNWGYFLITGVVLSILMYFVSRLVISRFKLSYGRFYPKKVRKIISSLGGEDNIIRIKSENVFVSNPNLVNILTLDCDIHGDKITLNPAELELIKEYF